MAKPNINNIKEQAKNLVVNHFEKGIFAVAGLLAIASLLGTRWAPYNHHPQEITTAVNDGRSTISAKTWPKEEQQQFVVEEKDTVEWLVANIRRQVDVSPYEFDLPFHVPLGSGTKPVEEPDFLPVQYALADAGRFLMGVVPEEPLLDEETEGDPELMADTETEDDQSDIPEEFRVRPNAAATSGGDEYSFGDEMEDEEEMETYGDDSYGSYGDYGEEGYGSMGGGAMASNMEGQGLRYVAFRGVIPLRAQIRKFMKALGIRSFAQASAMYEIIDFELERKKMQPGDEPWAGEWEAVDIEVAIDVLNDALTFDPEVVPTAITDPVVTMPLPGRLYGIWQSKATHPELENFTLSQDEIQKEFAFNQMMVQEFLKQEDSRPEEPVSRGGFSGVAGSARGMQSVAFGTDLGDYGEGDYGEEDDYGSGDDGDYGGGGYGEMGLGQSSMVTTQMSAEAKAFLDRIKNQEFTGDKERDEALMEYIKERITAVGDLLLFRYFDFDVEPGATYKYRVRLVVKNPNYGLPVAQAGGRQSIVEGQTRKSDWSNETEPTTVPYDVDYFVGKIDRRIGQLPSAHMALFQWNPDLGTTVFDSRLVVTYGEEVGGPTDTLVLDPAKNRFEIDPYKFHTGDVLVDGLVPVKVNRKEHPDLELPASAKGVLPISSQVLISKGNNELAVIDHRSKLSAFEARHQNLVYEQQPYEDIKNQEAQQVDLTALEEFGGEYEGGYGEGEDEGYGSMGEEDFGRGRRGGNPLRRRTSRRR